MTETAIKRTRRKPTTAQVEQVVRWLLAGNRESDILASIAAEWPDQSVEPLVSAAVEQLAAAGKIDRGVVIGWCVEATKDLYRRMVELGDLVNALRAVRQLADLAQRFGIDMEDEGHPR